MRYLGVLLSLSIVAACSGDDDPAPPGGGAGAGASSASGGQGASGGVAPGVTSECGSVRMTQYSSTDRRWCGFDRTSPILPDFVRNGMTVAIAEPYAGSSYDGEPGEACGECWQLDTTFGTEIVMVHDLCPIEGNPICAGSHFHFDVSDEVAASVDGGEWMGEASVRRVPCPVNGNIHAYLSDRNEFGYLKVAFFNHRFPIRTAEYQPVGSDEWLPLTRCLARWCVEDDNETFSDDGPGAIFRITSADGEVVEGTEVLTYATAAESDFDTGAQFGPVTDEGPTCEFTPPGDVYDEGFGGIEGVRWEANPWGSTSVSEVGDGCAEDSASCLLLPSFAGSGVHLTYRHTFPTDTFGTLTLQLRAQTGGGEVQIAPRTEDARCDNSTFVDVGPDWTTVAIDVAASCPGAPSLHGLTISATSGDMNLLVDEIRYE